jgi:hypothetical protein
VRQAPVSRIAAPLGVALLPGVAFGAPQASVGLTAGGAIETSASSAAHADGLLGVRADVLFGRARGTDMALGPYVELATLGFGNVDGGAGLAWLLPVRDDLPLVLSAGPFLRDEYGHSWSAGMETTLFFGSRSYNFHSWYGLAAGVFAQTLWVPTASGEADFVLGTRIDGELLVLPWLLLAGLFRQP